MFINIVKAIQDAFNKAKQEEIDEKKRQENLEKQRQEELRLQKEKEEQLRLESIEKQKRAVAERYARALDYAVTLVYYFRGYENIKYPEIVRTYEFGQITREEYDRRKKENPDSIHLVTYCNVLARKIGRGCFDYGLYDNRRDPEYNWLNWDLKAGYGFDYGKIFYGINPKTSKEMLIEAAIQGKIKELTPRQAQERANVGIFVMAVEDNHAAVIYPDFDNAYDENRGPKIAQAGWYNISNIYISEYQSWGANWKGYDIHFFEFPYEGQGFVDYLKLEEVV